MELTPVSSPAQPEPRQAARLDQLRQQAEAFEAVFLGLMLEQAGLGASRESFGGGAGEAVFSSMLAEQQAQAMVAQGGLGLATPIYNALRAAEGLDD
ncbi:MAG: rod-binding protein [Paracoccaceae bacterium]